MHLVVKNKKAQTLGLSIITMLGIFIVGFTLLNFLMPEVAQFRVSMNCATPASITDGTKLLCLMSDATVPYWILLILSIAIGGITARLVF